MENDAHHETEFGIIFDIDGVLAKGSTPFPIVKSTFELLTDKKGKLKYPIQFATNGLDKDSVKAKQLSEWLEAEITENHVIHAPSALKVFYDFHQKRTLLVGQENLREIAEDIGFKNVCFVSDIQNDFPTLDIVDHRNREYLHQNPDLRKKRNPKFKPIEVIVVMGEPVHWESALQIIMDVLMTNGNPADMPTFLRHPHIPLLACNMDLVFKADAPLPRLANGSFLACLEILYKRITGHKLMYTAIVGKPCEVTYRYAEHCLTREKRKLGIDAEIKRIYFIGDNPNVDIAGANWYNDYVRKHHRKRASSSSEEEEKDAVDDLPASRQQRKLHFRKLPIEAQFLPQTAEACYGILVKTGVYDPDDIPKIMRNHKDICIQRNQLKPKHTADDVHAAVEHILRLEGEL